MGPFHLHFLRHGAPITPGLFLGHTDMPLTAEGLETSMQKASPLSFQRIFSSNLVRCAQAAKHIADVKGKACHTDKRWRELDFGDWDGLAPSTLPSASLQKFWSDPDANPPPNGERWGDLLERVGQVLHHMNAAPLDTLIITHGGPIRAALSILCGLSFRQTQAFDIPYAALISLKLWPDRPMEAQIVRVQP